MKVATTRINEFRIQIDVINMKHTYILQRLSYKMFLINYGKLILPVLLIIQFIPFPVFSADVQLMLGMPSNHYHPGDKFSLEALIINSGPSIRAKLAIMLEIESSNGNREFLYYHLKDNSWRPTSDLNTSLWALDILTDSRQLTIIPPLIWPALSPPCLELSFIGALLDDEQHVLAGPHQLEFTYTCLAPNPSVKRYPRLRKPKIRTNVDNSPSKFPQKVRPRYVRKSTLEVSKNLADTWIRSFQPHQNAWSWDAGVLMMGFIELSKATGEQSYLDYTKDWLDHHLSKGYHITSSDTSIPGLLALKLYEKTGESRYLEVAHEVWEYISVKARRTSDGGLNHLGILSGNQLWIDSLFMVGPFLMEYGRISGSRGPYEEFALQLEVFRHRLRDPLHGVYYHRYDDDTGEILPESPLFWGRGNGWVFVASNLAYTKLPSDIIYNLSFRLNHDLKRMLQFLLAHKDPSGRFHTIINSPQTYLETSVGLLWAYGLGIGIESGLFTTSLSSEIATMLQGAADQIVQDEAGDWLLLGTSYGTSPGDLDYYNQVLKGENVSYGLGAFILTATQFEKLQSVTSYVNIHPDGELATETYTHPPVPCSGVDCGKFHLARGNFDSALLDFNQVLSRYPSNSAASFYTGLVHIIRFGIAVVSKLDVLSLGDITLDDFFRWILKEQKPLLMIASANLEQAEMNSTFTSSLERLLLIESGGHNGIGPREYDLGEAYLLDGVAHLVIGIAGLADQQVALKPSLQETITGIDKLLAAIDFIMAETDDQSDDFLPQNVLKLEGEYSIPGLLTPTNIVDLLVGLGLPREYLNSLNMPDDLINLLQGLRSHLQSIVDVLP